MRWRPSSVFACGGLLIEWLLRAPPPRCVRLCTTCGSLGGCVCVCASVGVFDVKYPHLQSQQHKNRQVEAERNPRLLHPPSSSSHLRRCRRRSASARRGCCRCASARTGCYRPASARSVSSCRQHLKGYLLAPAADRSRAVCAALTTEFGFEHE